MPSRHKSERTQTMIYQVRAVVTRKMGTNAKKRHIFAIFCKTSIKPLKTQTLIKHAVKRGSFNHRDLKLTQQTYRNTSTCLILISDADYTPGSAENNV